MNNEINVDYWFFSATSNWICTRSRNTDDVKNVYIDWNNEQEERLLQVDLIENKRRCRHCRFHVSRKSSSANSHLYCYKNVTSVACLKCASKFFKALKKFRSNIESLWNFAMFDVCVACFQFLSAIQLNLGFISFNNIFSSVPLPVLSLSRFIHQMAHNLQFL